MQRNDPPAPTAKTPPAGDAAQPAAPATASTMTGQQTAASGGSNLTSAYAPASGAQTSKNSSAANSNSQSPIASRDGSPARNPRRNSSTQRLSSRSRNNSQHDPSPSRPARTSIPEPTTSAPRALSSSTTPSLRPASKEPQIQAPTPQKPPIVQELRDNPKWPVSPRIRSPPPQLAKPSAAATRRSEQEPPSISVQRPTPSPHPSDPQLPTPESDTDDSHMQSGIRTPARGPLETVQEVSQNNSPAHPRDSALVEHIKEKLSGADPYADAALSDTGAMQKTKPSISGSQSASEVAKNEARRPTSVPPPLVSRQSSALSTKQSKSSKPEGSTQNMTVETETVPSVPQIALTTNQKMEGGNGTLKAKPSTETIKPKKKEKKPTRKQPAVSSATGSKADIFEAKIASAVDEANTSDSEETFVYDSNPPDTAERSNRRFHSRTPSATSMASQADRQNLRSIYGVMQDGSHSSSHPHGPVPKKSMKFVNTFNGNASDSLTPGEEDGKGTGRSAGGSARGTVRHHHHIGRWGRQPGNGHASLFDNESPFPNAAKSKLGSTTSRNSSGPPSPRNYHSARGHLSTKRSNMQMSSSYDLDDTTGADDERTPLLEQGRSYRGGRNRRGPHNLRQAESQTYTRRSSYLNRFAACLVLTMMFLLVITGAIGFMFATSQPMTGIEIVSITNVVTSQQVLMYDLTVKAHNPNIVVVTIDHANLEIFAKSEHAGTDSEWRSHNPNDFYARDDPINDPPKDPGEGDDGDSRPNVLLGRITEFDSPLTFEGSLFHQGSSTSSAEMQLANPGNDTAGGSERWERIYQNEFDLIIKGVVKYSLPLSAHIRSATVSGRTTVKPNSANDPSRKPNNTLSAFP
ncbi:Vacuolar inheritance and morphology protein [Purpureocillium takamizusanense]|uniref:Vacuolar inheritance and morphology protein n=1 Tax=Purpureocillium takamizusanense TaxID=2060973 RepID=A0A9Q8VBR7_9HYPO|nr:Vacuolar inheritance and morphology protein [Purpureocillium takamizusanense]UNI20810.1 Vacuolar inheritance and morphology protein [Purpureocillium takamizusanense]